MLQTLCYIPNTIAGIPLLGFGLLLAAWLVFSAALLWRLVRKQGWNSDTWGYLPLLALVAAIIAWIMPGLAEEQGVPIRGYGVMMLVAVLSSVALAVHRARQVNIDPDVIFAMAFWLFVPGIIGARAFYVIEYWSADFRPVFDVSFAAGAVNIVNLTKGGLVVFGSLIGAMSGLVAFVMSRRLPMLALCDLVVPSFALGQAIGRIGCLLNGCCFGGLCDDAWAVTFPPHSPPYEAQASRGLFFGVDIGGGPNGEAIVEWIGPDSPWVKAGVKRGDRIEAIDGQRIATVDQARFALHSLFDRARAVQIDVEGDKHVQLAAIDAPTHSLPIHPAQVYSFIDAMLLCILLLALDPYLKRDGQLFAIGLALHAVSRFLLEIIRIDESPVFGTGLSISQNISLLMFVAGAVVWLTAMRRPVGRVFNGRSGLPSRT